MTMRAKHVLCLLSLSLFHASAAQSLLVAISAFPELSNFTAFYRANDVFAGSLFDDETYYPLTVFVPKNDAFAAYKTQHNMPLTDISPDISQH